MGNVVPLRSKSEVRLRSAILSKLILLLLALTLQREKFKGVNAKDWPYTTKAPENDNGNVCSPLWGVGGGLEQLC